jgi:ferric-dicitrate binding protein FerR (iron transport regulator)
MNELGEEILLRYLQNECSAEELVDIDRWLGLSTDNRNMLFGLELAYHLPQKECYAAPAVIDKAEKKLIKRIGADEKMLADVKRRRTFVRLAWRYAAAAVITLTIAGALYFRPGIQEPDIVISVAEDDPVRQIILPDGTKVWLNQNSTLKYPRSYSVSDRSVYLNGEAFFDVTVNPKSSFVARSRAMRITVLGTTFNMRSYDSLPLSEVTLLSGEIEVKGNNDEGQIVLRPGQKAGMNTQTGRMTVMTVNAPLDAVWRDNLIPFNESSLSEIAKTLEHFYDVEVILDRNIDITRNYSGFIRKKDSIEEVLKLLTNSIPVTYMIKGDTVYMRNAR